MRGAAPRAARAPGADVRVLVWSEYSWPYVGGTEIQAMRLWPELHARGHEVTIVSSQAHDAQAGAETVKRLRVHRLPLRAALAAGDPRRVAALCRDVAALRRRVAPDVVVVASLGPLDLFLHQSAREPPGSARRHPPAGHSRAAPRPTALPGRTLRAAAWAVCCSASIRAEVCAAVPELRSRSSVIYHGVPLPPAPGAAAARPAPAARRRPPAPVQGLRRRAPGVPPRARPGAGGAPHPGRRRPRAPRSGASWRCGSA